MREYTGVRHILQFYNFRLLMHLLIVIFKLTAYCLIFYDLGFDLRAFEKSNQRVFPFNDKLNKTGKIRDF